MSNVLDRVVAEFPNRFGSKIDLSKYRDETYEPKVKNAAAYAEALKERMRQPRVFGDRTGFACDEGFRFRKHELTIWTGYKGHGKSALLSQVLLGLMQQGKKVFICSPEFPPVELLQRFLVQIVADSNPSEEEADCMIELLGQWLWLYDVQASLKPHDVPALCRWVADNIKPDHIVIDSLMKCGLKQDDYSGQKNLVDQLQSVAHQNPLHVHLVAHARKDRDDETPPNLHDVKGASEICDLAENVVVTWRNKPKEKARSKGDTSKDLEPDALFIVEAQRNCGGWIGTTQLFYNRDGMTYFEIGKDYRSYVSVRKEMAL